MHHAIRKVGTAAAALTAAVGLTTAIGAITLNVSAEAADQATTLTGLNVRSGPGTQYRVLGGLETGAKVAVTGSAKDGWLPVAYQGKTAYLASRYVQVSTARAADAAARSSASAAAGATKGSKVTTAALNVRVSPSVSASVVTVLAKGTTVQITGTTKSGYTEISYLGKRRWVSSAYLAGGGATPTPKPSTPTTATKTAVATAELLIRSTSGSDYKTIATVKKGTKLELTGVIKNNRAQVLYKKVLRWVNNDYVEFIGPVNSGSLPKIKQYKYATTALDIRSASKNSYTITEVPAGTKLGLTGVYADGRAQIIYNKAVRWVTSKYLSSTAGPKISNSSSGIAGLRPSTKYLMSRVQAEFPKIVTYYGVRPDAIPDHPSGKALDIMIPNYRSNKALGQAVATWVRAHARELNVEYVIWNQHIWNVKRDKEGWRFMASRGSDTANHKDHVHVTVLN